MRRARRPHAAGHPGAPCGGPSHRVRDGRAVRLGAANDLETSARAQRGGVDRARARGAAPAATARRRWSVERSRSLAAAIPRAVGASLRCSRVIAPAEEEPKAHQGRTTMITKTKTSIDRSTSTIIFQRAFAAPREDVFDAWTDPEQIK